MVPSPSFVVDRELLENNLKLLNDVQTRAGCKILLALKGFSMWSVFDLVQKYLSGTACSSLNEVLLGNETVGKENHVYAPAYSDEDFEEILPRVDHIVFNSLSQWKKFRGRVEAYRKETGKKIECALRINHGYSEVETDLYNPAHVTSRLGIPAEFVSVEDLDGIDGLHFHTMCEQGSDVLSRTLEVFQTKCSDLIKEVSWVNFGGGHHITRPGYDHDLLVKLVQDFRAKWKVDVYLEPGEAIALNTGYLVTEVMDVLNYPDRPSMIILDCSVTAHMPDVLEMPYRPHIIGAGDPGTLGFDYLIGGQTCLAGDVAGTWSFPKEVKPGDRFVLTDMAHYTMVKTTMFNGVNHPSIVTWDPKTQKVDVIKKFEYEDYKTRLS